jgi:hypothetical protein
MGYLCVIFTIWLVWNLWPVVFTTPPWFPYALAVALGFGGAALVSGGKWWYGPGLAGMANAFLLLTDLVLVTTDSLRTKVVTGSRRPR